MILNQATPDCIGGHLGIGGEIFQRRVGEFRGILSGHVGKNFGGKTDVISGIARAQAGFRGERGALRELRTELSRVRAQLNQIILTCAARIR